MALQTYRNRLDRIAASLAETNETVTLSPEEEAELEDLNRRRWELDLRQTTRLFFLKFKKWPALRKVNPVGLADRIKAVVKQMDAENAEEKLNVGRMD